MIVDFFFDYISPYAYLASAQLPALCERHGAELRLRPVLFAGLLNHWGQLGPAEIAPKAMHTIRDVMRSAARDGIACRLPRHHPFNPLPALRVSLAEVAAERQLPVMRAIFEAGWARGGDLGDVATLRGALLEAGLEADSMLAKSARPEVKEVLRNETEVAVSRGVFGVPTMLVGEELFWGYDQLGFLEAFLQGKDPLAAVDFAALGFQGPSAWRSGVRRRDEG